MEKDQQGILRRIVSSLTFFSRRIIVKLEALYGQICENLGIRKLHYASIPGNSLVKL